jgi:hypothetical protein
MPNSEALPVTVARRSLHRVWESASRGQLAVGFLGGSITDGGNGINWPESVLNWFGATFPEAQIRVENAAIGATGSDSGCLRADAEIIERGCDLTFIEYAVNDGGHSTERRGRSREGLIRKLLAARQEVVLVYTFSEEMREAMEANQMPPTVAEFESWRNTTT